MLKTAKYRYVNTVVNDRSHRSCTAKYITGSCTHSNFIRGSDSLSWDRLFLWHLDFLTTWFAHQATFLVELVQVSELFSSARQIPALYYSQLLVAPTDLPGPSQGAPTSLSCATGWHRLESKNYSPNQQMCCSLPGNLPGMYGRMKSVTGTEKRIQHKLCDENKTHYRSYHFKLGNHPFQNLSNTGVCSDGTLDRRI